MAAVVATAFDAPIGAPAYAPRWPLDDAIGQALAHEHLPDLSPRNVRMPRLSGHGVHALIEDLHQHGVQMMLASSASKGTIARVFSRFGLAPYFTHLVSGEDFAESKPAPAIFVRAAELAETFVSECIVIEDSANGMAAAKAANIYCVGYASPHSAGQDLRLADLITQDFSELSAERIVGLA